MTHITYTWGVVQLQIIAWDSYVRIPIFISQETSNNRFTIPESFLPIASKRQMIHYPKVTLKKKKMCSYELTQQARIHLGLLPQTSLGGTHLLSLSLPVPVSSCLGVTLVSISISISTSTFPSVPAYSIPEGYVHE